MNNTPDLEPRFSTPEGWREHSFVNNENGHRIHYGTAAPADHRGVVIVALGGLSEFSEKYFETARDMLARGHSFWFIDWQYQGRSGRMATTPHRRHSDGFEQDVSDLHKLISDYIKPTALHPKRGSIPLVMLAHSMGANIGLRYMARYPDIFSAAAFSAPLLGIKDLKPYPHFLLQALLYGLSPFHSRYVPGGQDWREAARKSDGTDIFSGDPDRDRIHNAWCLADPKLQVGNPTLRWVHETLRSCRRLSKKSVLQQINTPCLLALAGQESLVDNDAARRAGGLLPNATLLELEKSRHEILMERDDERNRFFAAFDLLLSQNGLSGQGA